MRTLVLKGWSCAKLVTLLAIAGACLIGGARSSLLAQTIGINAHGEPTGLVANPRRAEDALGQLGKSIEQLAGQKNVAGILAAADRGLDIVYGRTQGESYDGTPLVRDMTNGRGIRSRSTESRFLDGRWRNVVEINMKWQEFSIDADVDFVRVPVVDPTAHPASLQPWTAIYKVKVLRGNHAFVPLTLPIAAALPPPPPMPVPGFCDQIEQPLDEGKEYSITVHHGEGQLGGNPAQMTPNIFGGYIWCGLHPTKMIWFVTPIADTVDGDQFLAMVNSGMLAASNGQNPSAPEWHAKLMLDRIHTLASSAPVNFDAITQTAKRIEDDMVTALERRIDGEPGADLTILLRNNQTYGSLEAMAWKAGQIVNIRIRNSDPWPHYLMFVDFGEGERNFHHDLGCSATNPIRFGPLLMPPPTLVPANTTVDFPIPMLRDSGVLGGSSGIYTFDFFHHSRMIWTVHAK